MLMVVKMMKLSVTLERDDQISINFQVEFITHRIRIMVQHVHQVKQKML